MQGLIQLPKNIIVTGATGLIGKKLCEKLNKQGANVFVFTRNPENAKKVLPYMREYIKWNPMNISSWIDKINGKDAIINLAGENIMSRRWNEKHKKKITQSRLITTRALVNAINHVENRPAVFISASAIGYYGFTGNAEITEESKPGEDFLALLTQKWEREAIDVEYLGVRRVSIRIGVVLDKSGGALARMIIPFKFFAGGPLGSGKQWFSWIHIDDLVNLFLFALDNENMKGVYNATAPHPVRMKDFAKMLGKILHRPSILPVPGFVLKIMLGEGAEYLIKGSRVFPIKTLAAGFKFKYESAEAALSHLLN